MLYDHTSILRLVESKWNLPRALQQGRERELDCFDFSKPTFFTRPALPPAPPPTGAAACIAADPAGQ